MSNGEKGISRRGMAIAGLSIGLLVFGLVGEPAGGQEDDFVPGSAKADARIIRLGPAASQLSLAPTVGVALADYQTTIGRAESLLFDWVALDGTIEDVSKDFKDTTGPLRADTSGPQECWDREKYLPADPPAHRTTQRSRASPVGPSGHSEFHIEGFDIPGVLEMKGGLARSEAHLDGFVRTARATSDIALLSLGGGAVQLRGLRWEATQRTEADGPPRTDGSFSVEALSIAGQETPVPEGLGALEDSVNGALEPLGLGIQLPEFGSAGGVARMTPLGINVFPSVLRQELIGPLVGELDSARAPLVDGLFALGEEIDVITGASEEGEVAEGHRDVHFGCPGDPVPEPEGSSSAPEMPFPSGILVADILSGVLTGTGHLNVHLGGALAFTEGERFDSPFGAAAPFDVQDVVETIPGTPATPGSLPAVEATEEIVALPVSPAQQARGTEPGSRGGVAILIGAIGLALALVLAGTDWYLIRRGRALLPLGPKGG